MSDFEHLVDQVYILDRQVLHPRDVSLNQQHLYQFLELLRSIIQYSPFSSYFLIFSRPRCIVYYISYIKRDRHYIYIYIFSCIDSRIQKNGLPYSVYLPVITQAFPGAATAISYGAAPWVIKSFKDIRKTS